MSPAKPIRLILVGHQFFRKGGREVVETVAALRAEGLPLELVVISKIIADSYATMTSEADAKEMSAQLQEHADWITWHPQLPHAHVLELMSTCHVGLLPSYAETYGYSVLEMQSCGLPVITTNIRSFPEINNDSCGWLIAVPKRENGEARYRDEGGRESISAAILAGLDRILREIVENRSRIFDKGAIAVSRIRQCHNPETYSSRLRALYHAALS